MLARLLPVFVAVCALFAASFGSAEERTLDIVFEDYPPYEYVEDGQVKGVNMDIIREAFRRMKVVPTFEPRPWKRAVFQLQRGEILALSSGFKTAEREKFAWFPSEPLALEVNVVAVAADNARALKSVEDLAGLTVGIVDGYTYGEDFDAYDIERVTAHSMHQLVDMLVNKRIDVMVGNQVVIRHIARQKGKLDAIKILFEVGREPLYLFFSKARGEDAESLAREFGQTVRAMHRDGTFKAIQSKY